MVEKTGSEVEEYRRRMRELSRHRDFRARFRGIMKQGPEITEQQLVELHLNTRGSERAKAERLFRAIIKTIGGAEVPWYPEKDEAEGEIPEEDEMLMEQSEYERHSETDTERGARQRQASWPVNRGLPSTSEVTTASGTRNLAPLSSFTTNQQRAPLEQNGAAMIPRITIQEERNTTSRQHLRPPLSDIREDFPALRLQPNNSRFYPPQRDPSSSRERGSDIQPAHGARPKETWYQSRLSTTARNLENREDLDDEFVPSDNGFIRVNRKHHPHATPRQRRKIMPVRDSSSSSDNYPPPPLSSSRLQVDFRDLSPGSEEESRGKVTANRARWSRGEESRRSHQRSRRDSHQFSLVTSRDNSLHVIKTLKGWGLRYSGDEKESPVQFLSRLKACRRATGIPDEQLIPCLASILVREAGDWYEVYQDEMLTWDFRTFERAFKRQFVGELHEDDIMEELRARYQGSKEKIAPFITKFRRIIVNLKRPPPLGEQLNLTFTHLRPEYQDALWEKNLSSFEAIERYGRELERREAIKERYRSPPRREKSRIAGTNYTGPHRATHKVAAVTETAKPEELTTSERGRKNRRRNREPPAAEGEQVAATSNMAPHDPSTKWVPRRGNDQRERRQSTQPQNTPETEGERGTMSSQPAPYSLTPNSTPLVSGGSTFVGPCFVCQLVGHRAAECPKRSCYSCGQRGHFARDCPSRQAKQCQGCGREGATLRDCPNCAHIVAALGNGPARTR